MSEFHPKNKFSKFMAGKGFYVALAVCVMGAGTAAWVAVTKPSTVSTTATAKSFRKPPLLPNRSLLTVSPI